MRLLVAVAVTVSGVALLVPACSSSDSSRRAGEGGEAGEAGAASDGGAGPGAGGTSGSSELGGEAGTAAAGGRAGSSSGAGDGQGGTEAAAGASGDAGSSASGAGGAGPELESPCAHDFLGANCTSETALASGPGGALALAYRCEGTPRSSVQVARFDPLSGWSDVPNPGPQVGSEEQAFDIAVDDDGQIVIAYIEYVDIFTRELRVERFAGGAWEPVGPDAPVLSGSLGAVRLLLDGSRVLAAGCDREDNAPFVQRFDSGDSTWRAYPAIPGDGAIDGCSRLAFALDEQSEPVVAFFAYLPINPPSNLRLVRFEATSQTPSQVPEGAWDGMIVDTDPNANGIISNPALVVEGPVAHIAYQFGVGADATRIRRIDLAADLATSAKPLLESVTTNATSGSHMLAMVKQGSKLLLASGGQNTGTLLPRIYDITGDMISTPGDSTLSELSRPGVVSYDDQLLVSGGFNGGVVRLECFAIPSD